MIGRTSALRQAMAGLWVTAAVGCHPDIPHPISAESDQYCKKCHAGPGRAGALSSGHDEDKTGCTSCHKVTARGPYPALIPVIREYPFRPRRESSGPFNTLDRLAGPVCVEAIQPLQPQFGMKWSSPCLLVRVRSIAELQLPGFDAYAARR